MKLDENLKNDFSKVVSERNRVPVISANILQATDLLTTGAKSQWSVISVLCNKEDGKLLQIESNLHTPNWCDLDADKFLMVNFERATVVDGFIVREYIIVKWIADYDDLTESKKPQNKVEEIIFKFE